MKSVGSPVFVPLVFSISKTLWGGSRRPPPPPSEDPSPRFAKTAWPVFRSSRRRSAKRGVCEDPLPPPAAWRERSRPTPAPGAASAATFLYRSPRAPPPPLSQNRLSNCDAPVLPVRETPRHHACTTTPPCLQTSARDFPTSKQPFLPLLTLPSVPSCHCCVCVAFIWQEEKAPGAGAS
jgi:hypothetical protein